MDVPIIPYLNNKNKFNKKNIYIIGTYQYNLLYHLYIYRCFDVISCNVVNHFLILMHYTINSQLILKKSRFGAVIVLQYSTLRVVLGRESDLVDT